jgi:hypothetical protein
MHKNATKCNKTLSKWCKNKHEASKIIDMFETYQPASVRELLYPPHLLHLPPLESIAPSRADLVLYPVAMLFGEGKGEVPAVVV